MGINKKELIEAMVRYNNSYTENPKDFGYITTEKECATLQVEQIIKYVVEIRKEKQ